MNNDKIFAIYVTALIGGVASVITASVLAGYAAVPGPLVLLEHLALSFGFRAAYKSLAGPGWAFPVEETTTAVEEPATAGGMTAGAMG